MPLIKPYKDKFPKIDPSVFIAENAVIIGDVEIGKDSSVWYNVVIRGDVNYIRIGERTNIQDGTIIHVDHAKYPTIIGNEVTVGHNVMLHACTIQDRCLIGMSSTIMDGVIVESGSIVAAGALVPPGKVVKSGTLWAGVPAKYVRDLTEKEKEWLEKSFKNYVKYKNSYMYEKEINHD